MKRALDEMITYFSQQVSEMDIDRKYKIDLIGMITVISYEAQKQKWIPCSERLPENDEICLVCGRKGGICVARFWRNKENTLYLWTKTGTGKFINAISWMPLPEPYQENAIS